MSRTAPHCVSFVLRILLAVIGAASAAGATDIPVETMFQRAQYGEVLLSPDGRYLAAVVRYKGRNNLAVLELQNREPKPITNFTNADVLQFYWLNNDRLLFSVGDALEASGRARFGGWSAVDRDGSRMQSLGGVGLYLGPAVGRGDDIVVVSADRARSTYDVYRLNTYSGRPKLLSYDRPENVVGYVVDRNDVPRLAHSYLKGVHAIWYRESADASWIKLDEGTDLKLHFTPLAFDYDNKTLYVTARSAGDKLGVYTYDFQSKKLGELIAGSPQADISTLIFSRTKRALIGVSFQADKPGVVWLDPDMQRLQRTVDKALPDAFNRLLVADENPRRAVVFSYSDVNPGTIYLLDTEKLALEELGRVRPWIDSKQMAER